MTRPCMLMMFPPCPAGVTSGVGTGSLALGAVGTASGRMRAAVECVLVRQLMLQLHAELQDQHLYNSFIDIEMPSVLVLARMELNGMGGCIVLQTFSSVSCVKYHPNCW